MPAKKQSDHRHDPGADDQPVIDAQDAGAPEPRDLVLVKDGRRLVFRCGPGGEAAMIRQLAEMAEDPENDLTWFDAAVLSHQLGERFSRQIQKMKQAS